MFEKLFEAAGTEVLFCIIMAGVIYENFVEAWGTEVLLFFARSCSAEVWRSHSNLSHIFNFDH